MGRENFSKNEQRIMAHHIVFPRDLAVEECATHSSTQQHTSTHCNIPAGTLKLCDTQQRTDRIVISRDMAVEECAHRLLSLLLKEVGEAGRQTQEFEEKEGWIGMLGEVGIGEVGGWGRVPFSRNLMSPTPRRKWYLTTGRRFY